MIEQIIVYGLMAATAIVITIEIIRDGVRKCKGLD